jgi:hypothetical protein
MSAASAAECIGCPQGSFQPVCAAQTALSAAQVVQTAHSSPLLWAVSGVGMKEVVICAGEENAIQHSPAGALDQPRHD